MTSSEFGEGSVFDLEIAEPDLEGPRGRIDLRTYTPIGAADAPVFVWIHGGAFVFGDLDMNEADWVSRRIAERGVVVVSLDHRKATEGITHPVPLDDIEAGWRWAAEHTVELAGSTAAPHLGGASAGANLAAACALRCRDEGPVPSSLVLVYGVFHSVIPAPDSRLAEALALLGPGHYIDDEIVRRINLNYLGSEDRFHDHEAFPGLADLRGFPSTFVLNADIDGLRPSGELFAQQLSLSGTACELELEPESHHGYLEQAGEQALRSIDRILRWIDRTPPVSGARPG